MPENSRINARQLRPGTSPKRWSGYYFERMMQLPGASNNLPNPLWDVVQRIRDPNVKALNKFELVIFDPLRDVDGSPYLTELSQIRVNRHFDRAP